MSRPKKAGRQAAAPKAPLLALSMIVRDEEANLRRLLPPIASAFDQIVVADTGSSDGSREAARAAGATVVEFPWRDDFAAARNAALAPVRARWVLWLDADDAFEPEDAQRLRALLEGSHPAAAYYLELHNEADAAGERSACRQLRVFPRLPGVAFRGRIHEQVAASLERAGARFANAPIRVRHRGYLDPASVRLKFERNLRLLERERAERPDDLVVLFHLAQTHSGLGRRAESLAAIAALLAAPRGEGLTAEIAVRARLLAARLHAEGGDGAASRREIETAFREGPDDPLARLHAGRELLERGDAAGAATVLAPIAAEGGLRPAILPYPVAAASEVAALLHAEALVATGREAEALPFVERAALGPGGAEGILRFARRARAAGGRDTALAGYAAAAARDAVGFDARHEQGTLLLEMGRTADAERALSEALRIRPGSAAALVNAGNAALARGDRAEAEARYRRAAAAEPQFLPARENLGKLLLLAGRLEEALVLFESVLSADPSRVDLLGHAGDIHLARKRPVRAIGAFETLLLARPRSHVTWSRLGDAYLAQGAPAAARIAWAKALSIEPGHEPSRRKLAGASPAAARPAAATGA